MAIENFAEHISLEAQAFYHGTFHDIGIGEHLKPGKTNFGGDKGIRTKSVFITPDEATAWRYARMVTPTEKGAIARVYKVQPIGPLSLDETMAQSYMVPKAKVVERLDQPSSPMVAKEAFAPRGPSSADGGLRRKDQQSQMLRTRQMYGFK